MSIINQEAPFFRKCVRKSNDLDVNIDCFKKNTFELRFIIKAQITFKQTIKI